jgi:hypothetical protein
MELTVDLEISELIVSEGQVKLSYIFSINTSEFSGPVAGGQSLVSDPEVIKQAQNLLEAAKKAALTELGLVEKEKEELLDPEYDEDPL